MEALGLSKILVTGGSGFLGSSLANKLSENKLNKVYVFDNNFRGNSKNLLKFKNLIFVKGDIRNLKTLEKVVKKVDTIFHLAFINGTRNFYKYPDLVLDVGVAGTLNLIKAINNTSNKVKKFIYASSSEVYQTPSIIPTPENVEGKIPDFKNPRYSYGSAKMIGEILTLHMLNKGVKKIIFRPHNIYGPNMGRLHVIPQLLLKIKNQIKIKNINSKVSLKIQGKGNETRAFCYIEDAVNAILIVSKKGRNNNIYNIGTNKEHTIKKLVEVLEKNLKLNIKLIRGKLEKGSTLRRCPNINKIKKIGYRPKWSLKKGLLHTADFYLK